MPVDPDRVDEVFFQAQKTPPSARDAFLKQACGDDPDLRREVRSLLASFEETGEDFLEQPLFTEQAQSRAPMEGLRLGAFRISREIGNGGMSRVFLAVRDDEEVRQEVAIKVLKWGIGTEEAVRRFRRERQILAHLEHPFVARFLDAGTTDEGMPYVVMEHVEGEPITRYCEARRVSVRASLELFRNVCSAVQFAHQNLIVHRDLKPGNVLVTADGTPKLLDFGIAKLLPEDPLATGAPMQPSLTAPGLQPMTLAYASPEQVRGEAITTASDVYSLGVLLYQLLTGSRPYGASDDSALELARAACEDVPTRPSTTIDRIGGTGGRRRRLIGDLDSIILKALEKDPKRRYASVERFSEDVRRHLGGLPVQAREPTIFYRVGRYLRRHRLEMVSVLAVFLVTLGFSLHSLVLRDRAVREKQIAEEVKRLMLDMFAQARPEASRGEDVTARQVLDAFEATLKDELDDQPSLRAALQEAVGSAYLALGFYDDATLFLERALTAHREAPRGDTKALASCLLQLAHLRMIEDRYDEAEGLVHEALSILRRTKADAPDLAKTLNNLALLEKKRGHVQAAEKLYRQSLAMKIRLLGEDHADVATGKNNLAATLRAQGEYEEGERLCRESLRLRIKLFGARSSKVAKSLNSLAIILLDKGELAAAESLLQRSLGLRREIYGEDHPAMATALNNLGFLRQARGQLDEAEALYLRALEIRRQKSGDEHSSVARVLRNQATLSLAKGEPARAEALIQQALVMFRKAYSVGHPSIAGAESVFGECLIMVGRHAEAEPLLRRSHDVLETRLGPKARQTREARERLGRLDGVTPLRQGFKTRSPPRDDLSP